MFRKSTTKGKKYDVFYNDRWIPFGHSGYEHYRDSTGLGLWSNHDHLDSDRRQQYLKRAMGIKDAEGRRTINRKSSPNYWAARYLWDYRK